jgi:hypothetical protein
MPGKQEVEIKVIESFVVNFTNLIQSATSTSTEELVDQAAKLALQ